MTETTDSPQAPDLQTLGRYVIRAELGRGGFATVYRALDPNLDREVALKVLHPQLLVDRNFVARFRKEARALANLRHANIVTVYEVSEADGRLFIAMELAQGPSLADAIAQRGCIPWAEALDILRPVCTALDYAHSQGIVHRDLKPGNILLDKERGPLLTDFGLARIMGGSSMSISISGGIVGTPAYIAPEVWEEEAARPAADIYALGCVFYEMVTGALLFNGATPMHIMRAHDKGPQFAAWPAETPPGLDAALRVALAAEPGARYPSSEAFWHALNDVEANAQSAREQAEREAVAAQWQAETEQAIAEGEWGVAKKAVGRWLNVIPDSPAAQAARRQIERLGAKEQESREEEERRKRQEAEEAARKAREEQEREAARVAAEAQAGAERKAQAQAEADRKAREEQEREAARLAAAEQAQRQAQADTWRKAQAEAATKVAPAPVRTDQTEQKQAVKQQFSIGKLAVWGVGVIALIALIAFGISQFGPKESSQLPTSPTDTVASSAIGLDTKEASHPAPTTSGGGIVKIALLAPLSGDVATFGQSTRNGVLLAVEEWNAKGGIDGKKIELVIEDSQCNAEAAVSAANKVIDQDNVKFIIGEICSSASIPISEIATAKGIFQITPTSTNSAVTVGDNGTKPLIFRACFIDPFQGRVAAKFALDNLNAQTAAVFLDQGNSYVRGLAEVFIAEFEAGGGKVIVKEIYTYEDSDFSTILTKVKNANPDLLYLPDYYSTVNLIAAQAKEKGVTATMLGGDGWDSSDLDLVALDGSYFTNHFSDQDTRAIVQDFVRKYSDKYGSATDALAALAYDSANILFQGIDIAGKADPVAVAKVLETGTFEAVSGDVSFDASHNPVKSAVVMQIKNGMVNYVDTIAP